MSSLALAPETKENEPTQQKQTTRGLLLQYLLFKSLGPTKHHFAHLHDSQRWDIYDRALASLQTDNTDGLRVLNVGAGWGMLSALAQTHFPTNTEITSVERLKPVANAVREFLHGPNKPQSQSSTVLTNMEDDNPCNIVLLDILSPCLYEPTNTGDLSSGVLATLRSLQPKVTPTTSFLPRAARLFGCLVNIPPTPCVPALSFPLDNKTCGVHIGTFNYFRQPPQGFDAVPMTAVPHTRLTQPFLIETFAFADAVVKPTTFSQAAKGIVCTQEGVCNAMLIWHELDCNSDGQPWQDVNKIVSTAPNDGCIRRQAVVLLDACDVQNKLLLDECIDVLLARDQQYGHVTYFECVEEEHEEEQEEETKEEKTATQAGATTMPTTTTTAPAPATVPAPQQHAPLQGPRKSPTTVSRWHFSMLLDVDRNSKYQQAIAKAVAQLKPNDLVLDIGTGTGLLSCFAAKAGATTVVGCEANAPIARVAYQIVKKNKVQDQVQIVLKHSTDLEIVGADQNNADKKDGVANGKQMLKCKASLLISEILDCGLLGEGVLPVVRHARQHLLKEGGVVLPARARVKGVLVDLTHSGPIAMSRPTNSIGPQTHQMNGKVFNKFLRWNTWEQLRLQDMPNVVRLTDPFDMMDIDLRGFEENEHEKNVPRMHTVPCIVSGTVSAVVMWFEVDLDEEGEFMITTSPENKTSCWSQAAQLIADENDGVPCLVKPGEQVKVVCEYNDDRIKVGLL